MASIDEIRKVKLEKLELLRASGMEPFASEISRDMTLAEVEESFADLERSGEKKTLVGRVMALRGQGAIMFVVLRDATGEFQVVFKKDDMPEGPFDLFSKTVDMGDFISVTGEFFITKRGQNSMLARDWKMATKTLLPLPEKWAGLQDTEERYRKRYLDLLSNKETFDRFVMRGKIISAIRAYFDKKDFLEIETPILQNQAGGAMAKTFDTHHNDYDIDMVMRISLEIEHKMLMTGGYDRIYEIGKNFRNEGSDSSHIQEFTMMEWYAAYESLDTNMNWTEELLKSLASDVMGKMNFTVYDSEGEGVEVGFDGVWSRKAFADIVKENADIDILSASRVDLEKKALEYRIDKDEMKNTGDANLMDFIFKKSSRHKIIQPTFVTNYPGGLKPLAQQNEDGTADVAQLIIAGAEITNQYAELVDPIKERELLESQSKAKEAGDEEAMELNEEFMTAMEHGMPPMTGFGMGIDRIVAILTEQKNLRDTIFFPIMRPKDQD
jgi:lysyl-tRNA synthetase, class II